MYSPSRTINTDREQPGPGTYEYKNKGFGVEGRRYTLKSRVPVPEGKRI